MRPLVHVFAWTNRMKRAGTRISMDGQGPLYQQHFLSACGDL